MRRLHAELLVRVETFISSVTATISRGLSSFVMGHELALELARHVELGCLGVAVLGLGAAGKRIRDALYALEALELSGV